MPPSRARCTLLGSCFITSTVVLSEQSKIAGGIGLSERLCRERRFVRPPWPRKRFSSMPTACIWTASSWPGRSGTTATDQRCAPLHLISSDQGSPASVLRCSVRSVRNADPFRGLFGSRSTSSACGAAAPPSASASRSSSASRCVGRSRIRRLGLARRCAAAADGEARWQGHRSQHSAIKTESYTGIGSGNAERTVHVRQPRPPALPLRALTRGSPLRRSPV